MESKIIFTALKGMWKVLWNYICGELLEKVKEALPKAVKAFKDTLWAEIKNEVHACAVEVLTDAEKFLTSVEGQQKEEAILDMIMAKIELPLLLKPFKGLIRKIIKSKLENSIPD